MRIAVCSSSGDTDSLPDDQNWIDFFNSLECKIDYFSHSWNTNNLSMKTVNSKIDFDEKFKKVSSSFPEHTSFYSFMQSANLKRQHEISNNFLYDVCISIDYTVRFDHNTLTMFKSSMTKPKHNFVYTFNSELVGQHPYFKLNHHLFFSDSLTFDKLSQFYRFVPLIETATTPTLLWGFYIKMLKIRNKNNILPNL